jgi:hypothetical protein
LLGPCRIGGAGRRCQGKANAGAGIFLIEACHLRGDLAIRNIAVGQAWALVDDVDVSCDDSSLVGRRCAEEAGASEPLLDRPAGYRIEIAGTTTVLQRRCRGRRGRAKADRGRECREEKK